MTKRAAKAMDKLNPLKGLTLFEGVEDKTLDAVKAYFKLRRYLRGDVIWNHGQDAVNYAFIRRGKIKLIKGLGNGQELIVGVYVAGESIGETAVYTRTTYATTAVALDDTELLVIYRSHLAGPLKREGKLLERLLDSAMARNRRLLRRLNEVATASAEQRLAMLFEGFVEDYGELVILPDGAQAVHIDLPLSRRDLCSLINTRVETAIRIMSRWRKSSLVRTEKGGFLVLDVERLRRLAEEG